MLVQRLVSSLFLGGRSVHGLRERKCVLSMRFDWCSLCRVCCLALHIFNRFCCFFIYFKMILEEKKNLSHLICMEHAT